MSSDSESTDSDRSVPAIFRRKRLLPAAGGGGATSANSGESRRRRRVDDDVAALPVPRGFLIRRPAGAPEMPSPASLMSPAIPAAIVPTQPGRLYAPWPVGALQRAEPATEWLRLVQAAAASRRTRPPVVLPTRYLPSRDVAEPSPAAATSQRQQQGVVTGGVGGTHRQQECNNNNSKAVDLELRLGF